ncbi:MAG: CotH kinase family protein [Siphonobacter sp.]
MTKQLLLIFFLFISHFSYSQQLYINEIMASNSQTIADGSGSYEDWFEIYNPNAYSVNLAGYYLTDNLANPTKYQIPTTSSLSVPANGYLILWASEELTRGANHVNFKLSADGEAVALYSPDGSTLVDNVTFPAQRTDVSYGRKPDGSTTWLYFSSSTPSATNNTAAGYSSFLTKPVFSHTGGFYSNSFDLTITSADTTATMYYTTDGSEPDPSNVTAQTFTYKNQYPAQPTDTYGSMLTQSYQSYTYSAPLSITDQSTAPNKVSLKTSTASSTSTPAYFPSSLLFKGKIIKAKAFKANAISSETVTSTYFITSSTARYSVPVVSISLPEKHLFDYTTGIYTAGKTFDDWRANNPSATTGEVCTTGNFYLSGEEWERPANVEFFLNNTSLINQTIGLRIHGGCSSSVFRKSLRLYSQDVFDYPFFSERSSSLFHKRLILRNGGNDYTYSMIVDSYMQKMVRHLNTITQSNRAAVVFLNGEYWGVHSLDERYDKHYFNRLYNVDTDSLDLITLSFGMEVDEGDAVSYNSLYTYFANNNPVNYEYVKTIMDINNFTDYQISEIFSANTDWPHNNQVLWRKRTNSYNSSAPYGQDGRWRWALKDLDYGLSYTYGPDHNTLETATSTGATSDYTRFLRRLLDLPTYKNFFINRFADLLNTTFLSTQTESILNTMIAEYQPLMAEHFARWPSGNTYSGWQTNVEKIRSFVQQRPGYLRNIIRNTFGLSVDRNLTVNVSDTAQGYIKVNTIDILPTTVGISATPYPWTGTYFQDNNVTIVAKAKPGYTFTAWKEGTTTVSSDTAYSFNLTAARTLTAVFDLDESFNSNPPAYALLSCDYRFEAWTPTATAGTYPANMHLVTMSEDEPPLSATIADTLKTAYNLTSGSRINGLTDQGLAFLNTGSNNRIGGALLALRTIGLNQAYVQWTAGTLTPNNREYRIRLRYRIGDSGDFQDLLDDSNNPIEYTRNATAGHSQTFGPTALPATLLNKPYIQLLWQYYYVASSASGARAQLRLDDIIITRGSCESLASGDWHAPATWSCGRIPTICDQVIIKEGHQVTLQVTSATAKNVLLETNSKLIYASNTAALFLQGP